MSCEHRSIWGESGKFAYTIVGFCNLFAYNLKGFVHALIQPFWNRVIIWLNTPIYEMVESFMMRNTHIEKGPAFPLAT